MQPGADQGSQLFRPARIAVDGKNELHLSSQHEQHEHRRAEREDHQWRVVDAVIARSGQHHAT